MKSIPNWQQLIPVGMITLIGVLVSIMAYLVVGDWESQGQKIAFERVANDRTAAVQRDITSNLEILHSLKSYFLATDVVSRKSFRRFVTHDLARHKTIQALEWIPQVAAGERFSYESSAREEGFPDFQFTERKTQGKMVPAAQREKYFPVYYVEPVAGNEKAFGFDLASEPTRLEALNKARDTGKAVASGRITLVQEEEDQFGFLVFLPIYRSDLETAPIKIRQETLIGFVLGVFRLTDIVEQSLGEEENGNPGYEIFMFDQSASPGKQLLFPKKSLITSVEQLKSKLSVTAPINVGGRDWLIVVASTEGGGLTEETWEPLAVLLVGLLFSVLLSAYVHNILGQRSRVEQTVTERTAELTKVLGELSDVNLTLQESETRHKAILTSAADGIIAINEQGYIESFNPAAENTFGYAEEEVLGRNISMMMPSPYKEQHDRYLENYLKTGTKKIIGIGRQVTGLRKNGQEFPMDLSVNEIFLEGKKMFSGIVRDLTERIEAEEALEKSVGEVMQLREEQTLSEMQASWNARIDAYRDFVHTVGNLITPARIKASSLVKDSPIPSYLKQLHSRAELFMDKLKSRELESYLSGEGKRDLDQFIRGLEILEENWFECENDLKAIETALTRVIETTTAQSRLQKTIGVTSDVDLVKAIEGVLNLLEDNWGQKEISHLFSVTNEEGSSIPEVFIRVDKVRLYNMILNIMKNAGEAFAEIDKNSRKVEINLRSQEEKIVLEVIDNGSGLSQDELTRVGQIGFTTKQNAESGEGGSGMGIHNCQIFLAGIGGRFDITSDGPGKGAKATATFPAQVKA